MADQLKVERTGGFAGFGGPHLKSRGEISTNELSPADLAALDALFDDDTHAGRGRGQSGWLCVSDNQE